jgi:hypothetical protein
MAVGLIRIEPLGLALAVKVATAVAFGASLLVLGVLDHDDLGGVRAAIGRLRSRRAAVSA